MSFDFYCIPTLNNLELTLLGERVFCLAHFYKRYEHYRQFFLDIKKNYPGTWITLDNSAAERALVTEEVLLEIVEELKPNEVIAPDVLFDAKSTTLNLETFIIKMKGRDLLRDTQIFGCPQGKTKQDWIDTYDYMLNHPDVATIGMSKIAIPYAWLDDPKADQGIKEARHKAVDFLYTSGRIKKPLHFLGMGDPTEYKHYVEMDEPLLRSSDSCYSVLAATEGIKFEENSNLRIVTTEEFYHKALTAEELSLAIRNMFFLNQYTNY